MDYKCVVSENKRAKQKTFDSIDPLFFLNCNEIWLFRYIVRTNFF